MRPRSSSTRSASTRRSSSEPVSPREFLGGLMQAIFQQRPIPFPFPRPGGRRPPSRPLLPPPGPGTRFPPATPPGSPPPRNTRVRPDDRVNLRRSCARSRMTAAAGRKSSAASATSIPRPPASRMNSPGSTTSGTRQRCPGRALACDPCRGRRRPFSRPLPAGFVARGLIWSDMIRRANVCGRHRTERPRQPRRAARRSTFLLLGDSLRARIVPWAISYAVGTLLGVALLALLPEALGSLPPHGDRDAARGRADVLPPREARVVAPLP